MNYSHEFFTACEESCKNSHEFITDFERICHTRVTYTFHTSFIGSMNANSSSCSKYPQKVAFLFHTNFSHIFHNLFNNFVYRKFQHAILYAYSGMLDFSGQVLEVNMPVGRGTKGLPRPPVG